MTKNQHIAAIREMLRDMGAEIMRMDKADNVNKPERGLWFEKEPSIDDERWAVAVKTYGKKTRVMVESEDEELHYIDIESVSEQGVASIYEQMHAELEAELAAMAESK